MRLLLVAVLAAACAGPSAPAPAPAETSTSSARDTLLDQLEATRDLDGAIVGSSDAPATVVMVMTSWCRACRVELAVFDRLRGAHPNVRWLAVNYKEHEEYDERGSSAAIRALASALRWLRVLPAGEQLYTAVGRPTKIPTVLVLDRRGALVARYDRSQRSPPDEAELDALLRRLP